MRSAPWFARFGVADAPVARQMRGRLAKSLRGPIGQGGMEVGRPSRRSCQTPLTKQPAGGLYRRMMRLENDTQRRTPSWAGTCAVASGRGVGCTSDVET